MANVNELAKALGYLDFEATTGWLNRWKVRDQIVYSCKRLHADVNGAQEWISKTPPSLLMSGKPSLKFITLMRRDLYYR